MINLVEACLIQMGHEPAACDAIADTSSWFDLSKCKGVFIVVTHYRGGDTDWVLTVHEGATAAGTTAITTGAEFPIWVCTSALTDATLVRQTDGLTYTIDTGVYTGSQIVVFYIDSSILTATYRYVQLGSSGGNASSIGAVMYYGVGARFAQDQNL
jgi:hypothetical protein